MNSYAGGIKINPMNDEKKKSLTAEQLEECRKLKLIYSAKAKTLGISQESIAQDFGGMTQGGVGHYLNGRSALNVHRAIGFARILQVGIEEFSPRLAKEASFGVAETEELQALIEVLKVCPPIFIDEIFQHAKTKARLVKSQDS